MAATQRRSLVDDIFDDLSQRIASGELPPGLRLPTEKEFASERAVSRTVIREAVARLAAQGMVVARQGSGVFVAETAHYQAFQVTRQELSNVDDVIKLLEMRLAIETEMASLAATRRSDDDLAALRAALDAMAQEAGDVDDTLDADVAFHRAIARASGNAYFERFIDFLGVRLVPPRRVYLHDEAEAAHRAYMRAIWKEHEAIFLAIESRDARKARNAARNHMRLSLKRHAARRDATDAASA